MSYPFQIIPDSHIKEAKKYFKENPLEQKYSYKHSWLQYSILKTDTGELFALSGKADLVGQGEYSIVKYAQNLQTGELCAIKIQSAKPNNPAENIEKEQKILHEIGRLKGKQTRKNKGSTKFYSVIPLYEAQPLSSYSVILREALQGNLRAIDDLSEKNVMVQLTFKILEVAKSLALELQNWHDANILHRDLHPGNILIDKAFKLYIIDVGRAALLDKDTKKVEGHPSEGGQLRTWLPDQTIARRLDQKYEFSIRNDLYALDLLYFEDLQLSTIFNSTLFNMLCKHDRELDTLIQDALSLSFGLANKNSTLTTQDYFEIFEKIQNKLKNYNWELLTSQQHIAEISSEEDSDRSEGLAASSGRKVKTFPQESYSDDDDYDSGSDREVQSDSELRGRKTITFSQESTSSDDDSYDSGDDSSPRNKPKVFSKNPMSHGKDSKDPRSDPHSQNSPKKPKR